MAVDSVSLSAQNSYMQVQNRPKLAPINTQMSQAVDFHRMVDQQFNSFSKMSPAQILAHIQGVRGSGASSTDFQAREQSVASTITKTIRETVGKQEEVTRKSLIGEASMVELLTATTEAKNLMDATVKVRDEFLKAFDKVINMSM
ncbi:MAG: hypothetical protein COA94_01530 [Rickettsiales bacterium]|nr:MAG: hypothetical protein COA94_01530 [Rickettsiales bacterium]